MAKLPKASKPPGQGVIKTPGINTTQNDTALGFPAAPMQTNPSRTTQIVARKKRKPRSPLAPRKVNVAQQGLV